MTTASTADYELIEDLIAAGVLGSIEGEMIPHAEGTVLVSCADGDRISHILQTHWDICTGRDCHHVLTMNGGPLLIPEHSPIADPDLKEGPVLLKHITVGAKLKKTTTIVVYGHWPCGAAILANVSLLESLRLYVGAKARIRNIMRVHEMEPTIVSCFHVDYGNGKKVSYHFERDNWHKWLQCRQKGQAVPLKQIAQIPL